MTDSSIEQLERLIDDGFRLYHILRQSKRDDNLRQNGYSFIYFIDTPLFHLYAQPADNADRVTVFKSLGKSSDLDLNYGDSASSYLDRDTNLANALLTGEYIFNLGRREGRPVYISPEHAPEVFAYCSWLENRATSIFTTSNEDFGRLFGGLLQRFSNERALVDLGVIGRDEWLARARQHTLNYFAEATRSPILAPFRLLNLFQDENVSSGQELIDSENIILHDDDKIASLWSSAISQAKRLNRVLPTEQAIEADAVTLAQIQKLNRNYRLSRRIHLLITNDKGLHRAAAQMFRSGHLNTVFPLRYPLQYCPILNVNNIGGAYRDESIFSELDGAINGFVSTFMSTDFPAPSSDELAVEYIDDYLQMEGTVGNRMSETSANLQPFAESIELQVEKVRALWREALEISILAKGDVIDGIAKAEANLWSTVALDMQIDRSFPKQMESVREEFEALATSSTLLRQEIWVFEQGLAGEGSGHDFNRRIIATRFSAFDSKNFSGRTLPQIASDLRRQKRSAISILADVARVERLFFAGALCLDIGAWAAAKILLDRALSLTPGVGGLRWEVEFFRAVARRLAASEADYKEDYEALYRIHDHLLAQPGELFEQARILNETLALNLCHLVFQLNNKVVLNETVMSAYRSWKVAKKCTEDLINDGSPEYCQPIWRQFVLNSCNLLFWRHVITFAKFKEDDLERFVRDILGPWAGEFHYAGSVHGILYPLLAHYALMDEGYQRGIIADKISDKISQVIKIDKRAGFGFDIPYVDKIEFSIITRILDGDKVSRSTDEGV